VQHGYFRSYCFIALGLAKDLLLPKRDVAGDFNFIFTALGMQWLNYKERKVKMTTT